MMNAASPSPAASPPSGRSPALERRLRQRRADARVRLRLLSDCGLLAGHHASQPPRAVSSATPEGEVAALRVLIGALALQLVELRSEVAALRAAGAVAQPVEAVAAEERSRASESMAVAAVDAVLMEEAPQVLLAEEGLASFGKRARLAASTPCEARLPCVGDSVLAVFEVVSDEFASDGGRKWVLKPGELATVVAVGPFMLQPIGSFRLRNPGGMVSVVQSREFFEYATQHSGPAT